MSSDELKKAAAHAAVDLVEDGMMLGLGTGSTAVHAVRRLGELVARGLTVKGVPTSEATAALAREVGVPLTTLEETPRLDLTIDGADEIDADLTLIKGGGGALLREKIVAAASDRMVVIADASKRVAMLGAFPLPIEIVRFGAAATQRAVETALALSGCTGAISLRAAGGETFVTDEGHIILDAHLGRIPDARGLADRLVAVPGVVEHGLFLELADLALLAGPKGVERVSRS